MRKIIINGCLIEEDRLLDWCMEHIEGCVLETDGAVVSKHIIIAKPKPAEAIRKAVTAEYRKSEVVDFE